MIARTARACGDFLFADRIRPIEVFSGLNLIAWVWQLALHPQLLERDSYISFQAMGPLFWSAVLCMAAVFQLATVVIPEHGRTVGRIVTISVAAGLWFMIGISFFASGVSTTAHTNYFLLSLLCASGGVWLAWKK